MHINGLTESGGESIAVERCFSWGSFFARSVNPAMRSLERMILEIAPTDLPVFLIGESGTGKGVLSAIIHSLSNRRNESFIRLNCSNLANETTCQDGFMGLSQAQTRGTVLLDDILGMPSSLQLYLVEYLSDGAIDSPANSRVRIIASTTQEVEEPVRSGRFRDVLYYRLKGVSLRIPPLRSRKEDIPLLVDFFIDKHAKQFNRATPVIDSRTMDFFLQYAWPGNVREMENVVKTILVSGDQNAILDSLRMEAVMFAEKEKGNALPQVSLKQASRTASRQVERDLMAEVLQRTGWNRKRAARELQISYKALLYKLKQVGLSEQPKEE